MLLLFLTKVTDKALFKCSIAVSSLKVGVTEGNLGKYLVKDCPVSQNALRDRFTKTYRKLVARFGTK